MNRYKLQLVDYPSTSIDDEPVLTDSEWTEETDGSGLETDNADVFDLIYSEYRLRFNFLSNATVLEKFSNSQLEPVQIFVKFIGGESMLQRFVEHSNLYSSTTRKAISPITRAELLRFFGLNFLFSLHRRPCLRDYWCNEEDSSTTATTTAAKLDKYIGLMSRERYFEILCNLYLNYSGKTDSNNNSSKMVQSNQDGDDDEVEELEIIYGGDKLVKLRPLIVALNSNFCQFRANPDPESNTISIEERTLIFKLKTPDDDDGEATKKIGCYKLWCQSDRCGYYFRVDIPVPPPSILANVRNAPIKIKRSLYKVDDRKCQKWWHRLLWALFDLTVTNSYIAHCELHQGLVNDPGPLGLATFQRRLIDGLFKMANQSINKQLTN